MVLGGRDRGEADGRPTGVAMCKRVRESGCLGECQVKVPLYVCWKKYNLLELVEDV